MKITKKYMIIGVTLGICVFFMILYFLNVLREQNTHNTTEFSIIGNGTEPFWGFSASASTLVLREPSDSGPMDEKVFSDITLIENDNLIVLSSEGIKVTIQSGECSDGMSDIEYTHTTQLITDFKNYSGCANFD